MKILKLMSCSKIRTYIENKTAKNRRRNKSSERMNEKWPKKGHLLEHSGGSSVSEGEIDLGGSLRAVVKNKIQAPYQ
jgi:hypothetical protein